MNNHEKRLRHDNMVADGLSKLDPSFLPPSLSDVELLLKKAQEVSIAVATITKDLDRAARAAGTPHDVKTLATVVSRKFAEGFSEFSKDELIMLLTIIHTDLVVDAMTGSTETPKIIKPI